MNSWDKMDSVCECNAFVLGNNDEKLLKGLANAGPDHGKFLRMLPVYADITAPLYWWPEYDTYKVGTVANSCSRMHKIHAKEFVLSDFSVDRMKPSYKFTLVNKVIPDLNHARDRFLATNSKDEWDSMIQMLPSSYNQRRTVMVNYAVLKNQYHARKNHKLQEWRDYCEWVETLPLARQLIIGEE